MNHLHHSLYLPSIFNTKIGIENTTYWKIRLVQYFNEISVTNILKDPLRPYQNIQIIYQR